MIDHRASSSTSALPPNPFDTNDDARQKLWLALLDSAGEGIWGVDQAGKCTFVNRCAAKLFGYTSEEMLGRSMHALVHHHRADGSPYLAEDCPIYGILRGNQPLRHVADTLFRKDGTSFAAEFCAQPVIVEGAVAVVVVTFRDITDLRQHQMDLERAYTLAERRTAELDAVIESIPHGIYIATRDGQVRSNQRARDMAPEAATRFHTPAPVTNMETLPKNAAPQQPPQPAAEQPGEGTSEIFPQELHTLNRALAGESATETVQTAKGWIHSVAAPVMLDGEIFGSVAVNTDITQTRLQEEVLRRTEKLAAVGQLASSIAHEINNPLEAITNLLYLIRQSHDLDEIHAYSGMAESELARVTEITLQTLRFHRQQSQPTEVDMSELLRSILSLYAARFGARSIVAEQQFSPAPRILCLEGEIRQVANNLIRNAVDAMGSSGGRLMIRVHPQTSFESGKPGVRITVADNGEGIAPRILEHLYEPFQTTKEVTGTGLGLWVSKSIVDKHCGILRARTRRGSRHGTIFSLWFPVEGSGLTASESKGPAESVRDAVMETPTPISAPLGRAVANLGDVQDPDAARVA